MAARISGLAVAQATAGFVLLWSGLRNASIKDTLTGFAKGTVPQGSATGPPTVSVASAGGTPSSSSKSSQTAPGAPANVSGNVAKGKLMAAAYGWGSGAEWNALYALWQQESGWDSLMRNPGSGAFGIAQALNHGTASSAAVVPLVRYPGGSTGRNVTVNEYPVHAANAGSAASQIAWGLSYIKSRWGSPSAAWGGYAARGGWY